MLGTLPLPTLDLIDGRGISERYAQMVNDRQLHNPYDNHPTPDRAHPQHGSWDGHQNFYDRRRDLLRNILNDWDRFCGGGREGGLPADATGIVERARRWVNVEPPEEPAPLPINGGNVLDTFCLPSCSGVGVHTKTPVSESTAMPERDRVRS